MLNYPNLLSPTEIDFLKSSNRGVYKNPSDKYDNISRKADNSFGTILKILDGLKQIHHDSTKSKPIEKAKSIVDLYGNENVVKFVDSVFKARNKIDFGITADFQNSVSDVKMESALLAARLMRISIKNLKEIVGTGEYNWLLTKTKELEKEIGGVLESIRKRQQLENTIKDLNLYLKNSDPRYITGNFSGVFAVCLACNEGSYGDNIELALQKMDHTQKCKYISSDIIDPQKTLKWIRIIHGEDQKIIKELKNQEQST